MNCKHVKREGESCMLNNKHLLSEIMQADEKDGIYEAFDCKYVKRFGESCTLNNNCKFHNWEKKDLKSKLKWVEVKLCELYKKRCKAYKFMF